MKNLILIALMTISFFTACSKKQDVSPIKPEPWYYGTWNYTGAIDTTFYRAGGDLVQTANKNSGTLTFGNNNSIQFSSNTNFIPSFNSSTLIITTENLQYHVIKLSINQMELYAHYDASGQQISAMSLVQIYTKQ